MKHLVCHPQSGRIEDPLNEHLTTYRCRRARVTVGREPTRPASHNGADNSGIVEARLLLIPDALQISSRWQKALVVPKSLHNRRPGAAHTIAASFSQDLAGDGGAHPS
jgi:hypothetical protein